MIRIVVDIDNIQFQHPEEDVMTESGVYITYPASLLRADVFVRRSVITGDILYTSVTFYNLVSGNPRIQLDPEEPVELQLFRWVPREERYGFLHLFKHVIYRRQLWDFDDDVWYWEDDTSHI